MNSFGNKLILTTFGESHGSHIGGILDGFPAGFHIARNEIQDFLNKRKPGSSALVSPRKEDDKVIFLSGLLEDGYTTGAPIAFIVENNNSNSKDYQKSAHTFRPSHADYTYFKKYGIEPQPGGGRASARETVARCVAGAIAQQWLKKNNIEIAACIQQVGKIQLSSKLNWETCTNRYQFFSRCPNSDVDTAIQQYIKKIAEKGDSVGGIVYCIIKGLEAGIGEPIYDKLSARLAYAMLSINACKGFEIGEGFQLSKMMGSEANDTMFINKDGKASFESNHSGGIQGGISNGSDIYFRVSFKPTPSISINQKTINTHYKDTDISIIGRHDPCVAIRAVPVVEAMAALVIADLCMQL